MGQFPFDLQWWGNTSLGCYVFHFYFRTRMTELIMSLVSVFSFDPTGLLLFAAILAVCIFIQTTVGPLGHYILVGLQYIRIFAGIGWSSHDMASATCPFFVSRTLMLVS